jgi:hypothetical protein
MAPAAENANLVAMYPHDRNDGRIREPRGPYGSGPTEPDRYPAEQALRDLRTTSEPAAMARIVARYAALRAWILAADPETDAEFLAHARAAAYGYLRATPATWPGRPHLRRLVRAGRSPVMAPVLLAAAESASAEGCPHGAGALRDAAWREAAGPPSLS